MTAQLKEFGNISAHVVDIFGNITGRDQPIMKMDKAVQLVSCLDEGIFTCKDYVFFDPFCKAGEILLAAALVSIQRKSKRKLASVDAVFKELYKTNRYFALSPDERHWLLSLRTFYGNEKSHDKNFTQNIKNGAYLSETDGRLNKTKFKKELRAMLEYIKQKTGNKKIIAIGNPPYQEEDSLQTTGASPIYPKLIRSLVGCNELNEILLVIPSRWFNGSGRLKNFLEWFVKCNQIKSVKHFEDSKVIFPQVNIAGGICFFNWTKKISKNRETKIFYKDQFFKKILNKDKILFTEKESYNILDLIKKKTSSVISDVAWSGKPFGLRTCYFRDNPSMGNNRHAIPCYSKKRRILYANKKDITKNSRHINKFKIACPATYGAKRIPPRDQFFIIGKNKICLETYNIIHSFEKKKEADIFLKYIQSIFVRFLLGLAKNTQRIVKEHWRFVPLSIHEKFENDEDIFKFFRFNKNQINYIKEKEELWSNITV